MSGEKISKKELEHLAELARIELDKKQEEKLLGDLKKILEHFEELKEVDVSGVEPMAGGTVLKNSWRQDIKTSGKENSREKILDSFPQKEGDFLKIPPVFE